MVNQMGLIVQKFGGSSVADAKRIQNVAEIVTDTYKKGNDVVVVVSAQGDTTDDLIEKAKEINAKASKREMDVLLSAGEVISMSLLAMAIQKIGCPVISLTGWQAGVITDSSYSSARIKKIDTERVSRELDRHNIVIVAGFQGINKYDDITTLGRGGSDTSAVALAASLKADSCQIYTDVDGVYSADPRKVKDAVLLSEISYDEMLELASCGAQVLHNRSVEMAKKYNVKMEVLSSFTRNPGTQVKGGDFVEKMLVSSVAKDSDVARISVIGVNNEPGIAFKMFSMLANKGVNVDIILQSVGRDSTKDISFTTTLSSLEPALEVINENLAMFGDPKVVFDTDVAKVSIVGAGMMNNVGVAAKMFEALYDAHINIQMISTSEIKISVLIDKELADVAVNTIHSKFINK